MLPEITILGGIALATTALICEELDYSPVRQLASATKTKLRSAGTEFYKRKLGWGAKGIYGYVSVCVDRRKTQVANAYGTAAKDELTETLRALDVSYRYLSCYNDKLTIMGTVRGLHATRTALRKHFGYWSDKVESSGCGTEVEIVYRGKLKSLWHNRFNFIDIEISYPLDELPDGLLKPGCVMEITETVVKSCSITCSG